MSQIGRNRLGDSRSPYLRQHKNNPVHWWEWGDEAFAEAARSGRPVLLSVGYAACHWCHVMAHESFESESIAAVMNAMFVNIKVDREERPDIDFIYMSALHALGEQGGWPLTMFLDANRKPFWGGTYFPPVSRYGRPGFPDLLKQVAAIYANDTARISHNTTALTDHLRQAQSTQHGDDSLPSHEELLLHARRMLGAFDPVHGGLSGAPKFPNPPILNMLWRAAASAPEDTLHTAVLTTLRQMARGGIHDHIGGGFARYSVDAEWLVPHFEKMLYDNAQLLELYALAATHTGEPLLQDASARIVSWLMRDMKVAEAFASSLDADSEGVEGKYYVWSRSEVESILGADTARIFSSHYDITNSGNFEGHNIPNLLNTAPAAPEIQAVLETAKTKLLQARSARVPPARDDKVLADWNGLMITALVRAGVLLNEPDWIAAAHSAYFFIRAHLQQQENLAHSWLGGVGVYPAFSLDHAAMALAAITLAEATGDPALLTRAANDLENLHTHYSASDTGLLAMTHAESESLIVRPAPLHDDAVPNANGVYAEALVRLGAMTGNKEYLARLDRLFSSAASVMRKAAMAHSSLWSALDLHLTARQVIVVGPNRTALLQAARRIPFHRRIVIEIDQPEQLPSDHPVKTMLEKAAQSAMAFVCRNGRCELPIRDPDELSMRLGRDL